MARGDRDERKELAFPKEGIMGWRRQFVDQIAEILRFIGYSFLFFDAIILSLFTLWFTGKFLWFFTRWLNRVIFSSEW